MTNRTSRLTRFAGSSPTSSSVRPGVFIRPRGALTQEVVDVLVQGGVQEALVVVVEVIVVVVSQAFWIRWFVDVGR